MSEAVLIALVHFFAFISNFSKSRSEKGREVVEQYLRRHINPKLASDFLSLYDEYIDFYSMQQEQGIFTDLKSEISKIVSIGDRIKKDLDEKERLLVYIRLLEYSKEIKISGDELNAFLEGISTSFLIKDSNSMELKSFVQEKDTGLISKERMLILSGAEDSLIPDSFKPEIHFKQAQNKHSHNISGSLICLS